MHLYKLFLSSLILFILITAVICKKGPRGKGKNTKGTKGKNGKNFPIGVQSKNNDEQCPYLKDKGGRYLFHSYDSSVLASTLVEAVENFRNPTAWNSEKAGLLMPEKQCKKASTECRECKRYVFSHLLKQVKQLNDASLWNEIMNSVAKYFGRARQGLEKYLDPAKVNMKKINKNKCPGLKILCRQKAHAKGQKKETLHKQAKGQIPRGDADDYNVNSSKRVARSIRDVELVYKQFETIHKIDCKKRGDPVKKGSAFLNLCNNCWEWGYLRENFYPRYVNMNSCQKDTRCLSGWGTCGQRIRSVQVLQNTAAPGQPVQYKPLSWNVPVVCDCQVKAGSALHDFVKG